MRLEGRALTMARHTAVPLGTGLQVGFDRVQDLPESRSNVIIYRMVGCPYSMTDGASHAHFAAICLMLTI